MVGRSSGNPLAQERAARIIINNYPDCWKSFFRGDPYYIIAQRLKDTNPNLVSFGIDTLRRALSLAYFGFDSRNGFHTGILENADIDFSNAIQKRREAQRLQDRLHLKTGYTGWSNEDEEELIRLYTQGFGVGIGERQIYRIGVPGRSYAAISAKILSLKKEKRIQNKRLNWEEIGPLCERLFDKERRIPINASYVAEVLNRYLYGRNYQCNTNPNSQVTRGKVNNFKKRRKKKTSQ